MNKNIIKTGEILEIFIDSNSFEKFLSEKNKDVERVLRYSKLDLFKFIRSPLDTNFKELGMIPGFKKIHDENRNITDIQIKTDNICSTILYDYEPSFVEYLARKIYNKSDPNPFELNSVESILVFDTLKSRRNSPNPHIFVTNNEKILNKRLILESSNLLNSNRRNSIYIVNVEESKEIMDLFLKYRNKYILYANPITKSSMTVNKGQWYSYSFRSKVPNFHVGVDKEPFLDAFSSRFVYLLRSLDEIGIQYYSGANNDTLDDTMYHFNYFISLITGIFDALALTTKNKYNLTFRRDDIPSKTSLHNKAGEDFLKALRDQNKDLRKLINQNVDFIKLIYELRELVIHRKMLEKTLLKVHYKNSKSFRIINKNGWKMNCIKIDKSILNYFPRNDKKQKFKSVTNCGVCQLNDDYVLLEPYDFSKKILKILIQFSNEYLELLGFNDFLEELKEENPEDKFIKGIELFRKGNLGV